MRTTGTISPGLYHERQRDDTKAATTVPLLILAQLRIALIVKKGWVYSYHGKTSTGTTTSQTPKNQEPKGTTDIPVENQ